MYYRGGRCVYEEKLNPGYHDDWRCAVLVRWEQEYDTVIRQAEAFNMEGAMAANLWERKATTLMYKGSAECSSRVSDYSGDMPGCVNFYSGNCLLTMPECGGRCTLYRTLPKDDESDS